MVNKLPTITTNIDVESIDIPTMLSMTDEQYSEFVNLDGLFYVDHHETLRVSNTGCPVATTREQVDVLIERLKRYRNDLLPRSEFPDRYQHDD